MHYEGLNQSRPIVLRYYIIISIICCKKYRESAGKGGQEKIMFRALAGKKKLSNFKINL